MKRSILVLLVIGVTIIFLGCSEDNCTAPVESNQAFAGTSIWVADIDPGVTTTLDGGKTLITGQTSEWYDSTGVSMVTGKSFWDVNWLIEEDGNAQLWGTSELLVDDDRGKWKLTWSGQRTPTGGGTFVEWESPFRIEVEAVGTGIEGDVNGLEAKWTFTMDFNGDFSTLFYKSEGYIVK